MRLTFLKWYFYSIIKLKKLKMRKTMIDKVHYDNYPCGIEKTVEDMSIDCTLHAATNINKVTCPECLEIISTIREDG